MSTLMFTHIAPVDPFAVTAYTGAEIRAEIRKDVGVRIWDSSW